MPCRDASTNFESNDLEEVTFVYMTLFVEPDAFDVNFVMPCGFGYADIGSNYRTVRRAKTEMAEPF